MGKNRHFMNDCHEWDVKKIMFTYLLGITKIMQAHSSAKAIKQIKIITNVQYLHHLRSHLFLHTLFSICTKKTKKNNLFENSKHPAIGNQKLFISLIQKKN